MNVFIKTNSASLLDYINVWIRKEKLLDEGCQRREKCHFSPWRWPYSNLIPPSIETSTFWTPVWKIRELYKSFKPAIIIKNGTTKSEWQPSQFWVLPGCSRIRIYALTRIILVIRKVRADNNSTMKATLSTLNRRQKFIKLKNFV